MRPCHRWQLCALILSAGLATSGLLGQDTIFSDDFQRPDGPPGGWTLFAGTANIALGRLVTGPTSSEHWFWAGNPAAQVPRNATNVAYDFQMEFLAPGTNAAVGRHAGFQFNTSQPTQRFNPNAFSGYFVDWIDRASDRGVRLTRVDNGTLVELVLGAPGSPPEPPLEWRVETDDTSVRVYGDGVLLIDIAESTYRGGSFGFWAWSGGEEVAWDNLEVTGDVPPVSACFTFSPASPLAGTDVFFDGRCSSAATSIASYSWEFGDSAMGSGATVEHTYAFSDNYAVTLTVRDPGGNTDSISLLVPVGASLLPFSDDFDRAAGPVDGWTAFAGEWNITAAGKLETLTAGSEHWLWAGDPPGVLTGDFVAEFDMEFLTFPGDGVGRHAGFMFFAGDPTIRWQTTGYFVDWIDRPSDRGIRLTRADPGGLGLLIPGAPTSPPEPPATWRVEVEGPMIRVYGDNILHIEIQDSTYREGHAAFWAYSNGQDVLVDNLEIASEIPIDLTACFTAVPASGRIALAGKTLRFDGGCSVAPAGAQITAYEWNFGDAMAGNGRTVEHTYAAAGTYPVTLTVRVGASNAALTRDVVVSAGVLQLSDDFNRPDGAVGGWTPAQGDWSLLTGTLVTGPTAAEHWIWAGAPPVVTSANATFEFEYSFLGPGSDPVVGRHGGFQFAADHPTQRTGAGAFSGYFMDWIDRPADAGLRLSRVDRGTLAFLGSAPSPQGEEPLPLPEPPLLWRVEVDGDHLRVFGDGALYLDVIDATYRGGFFGFWTWTGNQEVAIDNFELNGVALTPCFTASPARPAAGEPVDFDAGCSEVFGGGATITSYAWDFGDGSSTNGLTASHAYEFADTYTVTLTVRDSAGGSRSLERLIPVAPKLLPFADCFDRGAGPVGGWTVFQGDWQITDAEQLSVVTPGGGAQANEAWIWAGDPPGVIAGDLVLEFEKEYLFDPMDGVGRHAGIMIYASAPTIRWQMSGYTIWWIDRVTDFGIVVMRWDNGALTALNPGTLAAVAQPPLVWRVEVEGAFIRVFGDGVPLVEVEDDTYREGHLGFWAYANSQDVRFDSLRVGAEVLPECGPSAQPRFIRGDIEQNGAHTITDAIRLLSYLFLGTFPDVANCLDAADVNDNARVDITDPIYLLSSLFQGGLPPPPPFTACGVDSTPDQIECVRHTECP